MNIQGEIGFPDFICHVHIVADKYNIWKMFCFPKNTTVTQVRDFFFFVLETNWTLKKAFQQVIQMLENPNKGTAFSKAAKLIVDHRNKIEHQTTPQPHQILFIFHFHWSSSCGEKINTILFRNWKK